MKCKLFKEAVPRLCSTLKAMIDINTSITAINVKKTQMEQPLYFV